ncbi:hypothetical protein [Falsiroseomonas sp.]|uniref:hypothetical protein n=1 Tax=Falsiroseomonas sp. TaxID=2870721 RepID=UPI0034A180E6
MPEVGFIQPKRRLGSVHTTRHDTAQDHDIILPTIIHNFMLLAQAPSAFSAEHG